MSTPAAESGALCLADRHCEPCRGGVPALSPKEQEDLLLELRGWDLVEYHHLQKSYALPDFVSALSLLNRMGEISEQEGHHPELTLGWGYLRVSIWTHKVDGLTEADFVLAAKLDRVALGS